ncbi:MAG TPA: NAD-dependent epimerase/dehydratase family protein [Gemmatimonadales bacterium]|nr:NAD-dependent epimerase/dehydratase family protein [Gemmatimonadales bacterium]
MRILVTGADGFVGGCLLPRLAAAGHEVIATARPASDGHRAEAASWIPLELDDPESIAGALAEPVDAIVHLAAVASNAEARRDPGRAWSVNAAGTARLAAAAAALKDAGGHDPLFLLVSSGEVYGSGPPVPRREDEPVRPQSPYAASKAGAELAVLETGRRTGLRVIVVRPFQHTGPAQSNRYVVPALARRLLEARAAGQRTVRTGSLEPVRDILDVRDVVDAYLLLLERGVPGTIYNVARGEGVALRDLFDRLAALAGVDARPEPDPALMRTADVPWLVGDPSLLHAATGWRPALTLEQTLKDVVDAQAH